MVEEEEVDLEDIGEDQRAAVVREFLKVIASELKQSEKTIQQVFIATENKLFANNFVAGLKTLGLENFDKNILLVFIESLQSEDEDDQLCINYSNLEQLLDQYLTEVDSDGSLSEEESDI